jgi:ABC-type branched-subunit amino acid transport system permease subunit
MITEVNGSLDIASLSIGFLVRGLAAALVGGLTSLSGAIIGGLIIGIAEAFLQLQTSNQIGAPETLLFAAVLVVLVVRPRGLFGQPEETEDKVAFVPAIRALPKHLRGTSAARIVQGIGVVLAIAVVVVALNVGSATTYILTYTVLFGMIGVSLTVLMGYSGQMSLGQWGLAGVGAFALAQLYAIHGVPYLLALVLAFAIGMLVSLLIGLPALRIRGPYLAVATLAFNLAAAVFIFRSRLIGNSTAGIIVTPPKLGPLDLDDPSGRPMFMVCVVALLLMMLLARNLARTRTGRGFYALRENEKAAATLGVSLTRYKLLAFAVSGGMAALAGALFATHLKRAVYIDWSVEVSLVLVAMVVIGGLGSMTGAVLGAFIVFALPNLLHFQNPWIVPIATGLLLIVVIVRAPGGLGGLVQAAREDLVKSIMLFTAPAAPTGAEPPAEVPTEESVA